MEPADPTETTAMPTATIDFDEDTALSLQRVATAQGRSPTDIIRAALAEYLRQAGQEAPAAALPPGVGAYRSGRPDVSSQAEEILRDAARERRWP